MPEANMIHFTKPTRVDTETEYVLAALASSRLSGEGMFAKRATEFIRQALPAPFVALTPSCTASLEMSCLIAGVGPGDEVIVPSYTFTSTANAAVLLGARIVFVDVEPDTLHLDPSKLEAAWTPKTRAIIPVHYAGVPCDMEAILAWARERKVVVIEDAAQAWLATRNSKLAGTFGDLAAFSFHDTKNITCGEGGATIVNRVDWIHQAEVARDKGTNRTQFFRGEVDKYTWVNKGSSYLLPEVLAAFLLAQLEAAGTITKRRLEIWNRYHAGLDSLERKEMIRRPRIPRGVEHNGHLYFVVFRSNDEMRRVQAFLATYGVQATTHYVPLHQSVAGKRFGTAVDQLPVAEDVPYRLLRLPLHGNLSDADVDRILDLLEKALRD
jgi:dTDP-4-amino-4,6-dideoxygalactose transaminase